MTEDLARVIVGFVGVVLVLVAAFMLSSPPSAESVVFDASTSTTGPPFTTDEQGRIRGTEYPLSSFKLRESANNPGWFTEDRSVAEPQARQFRIGHVSEDGTVTYPVSLNSANDKVTLHLAADALLCTDDDPERCMTFEKFKAALEAQK